MTVRFDEVTATWFVVDGGAVLADGFATNAQAWRWVDDRCDQVFEETHDRIRNVMRER
jgi:hypothetical protein